MSKTFDLRLALIERIYQRTFRHLEPQELKQQEPWPNQELHAPPVPTDQPEPLFLNYYSAEGLRFALERYGFMNEIRRRGFARPILTLQRHEEGYDIARIQVDDLAHPLVELMAQVGPLPGPIGSFGGAPDSRFLIIRWMRMQNPRAQPRPGRPLLPGQDFPGLGLGREMMVLIQLICARLRLDGVLAQPERIHNAALYFARFRFLDPELQGILTAILRDTRERKLAELAWGVELGALIDRNSGKPVRWITREQVLPRTGPIVDYLNSEEYRRRARAAMGQNHFALSSGDMAVEQAIERARNTAATENPFPSRIK